MSHQGHKQLRDKHSPCTTADMNKAYLAAQPVSSSVSLMSAL